MTSPRRRTNQRCAMVAANTSAIEPVPSPMRSPQKTRSCHDAVMSTLPPAPSATSVSAAATTWRMPKRSMSAAANGAVRPYRSRFTLTARDMMLVDQPNSSLSGTMSAPGAARNPAAASSATNATAATSHAGWSRRGGDGGPAGSRASASAVMPTPRG